MTRSRVNRFDVQVAFPDITFGIKNRPDVTLTPEDVVGRPDRLPPKGRTVKRPKPDKAVPGYRRIWNPHTERWERTRFVRKKVKCHESDAKRRYGT